MNEFMLFAQPWWVNLLIAIPLVAYYVWRKEGLVISKWTLVVSGLFGVAFGFIEASVVVYLRTTVRWPSSLVAPDVLFLIPVPWFSQVWFPILISALTMAAVVITRKDVRNSS